MAELLVCAVSVVGDDVYKNAKLPKVGNVVCVQANGWNWGKEELTNPLFRIIQVPSVSVAAFSQLLSPEVSSVQGLDPVSITNTLQYRGFRIDVTNIGIPAVFKTWWADTTRAAAMFSVGAAAVAAIQAAITANAPIANPAIIGTSANLVG